jgi:hypothetical protein
MRFFLPTPVWHFPHLPSTITPIGAINRYDAIRMALCMMALLAYLHFPITTITTSLVQAALESLQEDCQSMHEAMVKIYKWEKEQRVM